MARFYVFYVFLFLQHLFWKLWENDVHILRNSKW